MVPVRKNSMYTSSSSDKYCLTYCHLLPGKGYVQLRDPPKYNKSLAMGVRYRPSRIDLQ
mgnify:CR=1 FL=1